MLPKKIPATVVLNPRTVALIPNNMNPICTRDENGSFGLKPDWKNLGKVIEESWPCALPWRRKENAFWKKFEG
jgi:hypothetical protein